MPSIMAQFEKRRVKLNQYWLDYKSVQTKIEFVDESESEHRAIFEEIYALSSRMRELTSFRATLQSSESTFFTQAHLMHRNFRHMCVYLN